MIPATICNTINAEKWINEAERDGYVIIRGLLDPKLVAEVRKELTQILEQNRVERSAANVLEPVWAGGTLPSEVRKEIHTVYFPLWESPGLQELISQTITHPDMVRFLKAVVGEYFRLRIDLVRSSTGINDKRDLAQIPSEWHRDSTGEFTFGFFFDDLCIPESGGTAVIPGTHWQPYSPFFDFVIGDETYTSQEFYAKGKALKIPNFLTKGCLINRSLIRPYFARQGREILGKPGDVYFFLNETWHGRAPNIHGGKNIMVRMGGFATDFPFKADIPLSKDPKYLPSAIAERYSQEQVVNKDSSTLLRRIQIRQKDWDRFYYANLEKKFFDRLVEWNYPLALKMFGSRENIRRFFKSPTTS